MRTANSSKNSTEFIRDIDMGFFNFSETINSASAKAEERAKERFAAIDETGEYNQQKVLAAFINNGVTEPDFGATTGYG